MWIKEILVYNNKGSLYRSISFASGKLRVIVFRFSIDFLPLYFTPNIVFKVDTQNIVKQNGVSSTMQS